MTDAENFKTKKSAELEEAQKRYKKEEKIFLAILATWLLCATGAIICIIGISETKNLTYTVGVATCAFLGGFAYAEFLRYQSKKYDTFSEVISLEKELNSGCERKELISFLEKIFPKNIFIYSVGYRIKDDPMDSKKMCVVLYTNEMWPTERKTEIEYLNYWANEIKDTQFDKIKLYIKKEV